jgi:molecular chaperone DnaJ
VNVPTLEGSASVAVPPGTQPDAVLRLKGKGLPAFGEGQRGDLHLRIGVRIPDRLTHQEHELYEKLRALGAGKVEKP